MQATTRHPWFRLGRLRSIAWSRQEPLEYVRRPTVAAAVLTTTFFPGADVTMVSPSNYFNFTPLLASCSVGTLEFRSAVEPVRPPAALATCGPIRQIASRSAVTHPRSYVLRSRSTQPLLRTLFMSESLSSLVRQNWYEHAGIFPFASAVHRSDQRV